jgi:uncharacterized protein
VSALYVCMLACGGTQKPAGGGDGSSTKVYEPLTIKADAKAPNMALILGTDERNGSTLLRLPATQSNVLVDAMFVKLGGNEKASGGSTPVKLATTPNADGTVQVGIFEEMSGGTGQQWRAGVWVSAFVAANTLGKDLTDFTFTASSGGYIDGASASGLMAGGFLATIIGDKIDPTVTMTGIINPDGTIGPVSGIPEKFVGSIEKGKKRLGYPIGMRYARSEASGEMVDLVKLAKDKGAEAIEISNVHEAYKLLTGKHLPEPVPVAEKDMALDPDTTKALDGKYKDWQQKLATAWAAVLQLQQSGKQPQALAQMTKYAQERVEAAEKLHQDGRVPAAFAKQLAAWVYAQAALDTYEVLQKLQAGNATAATEVLARLDKVEQATADAFKKIGALRPNTMGGHLLMMGAFQAALRAYGFKTFASEQLVRAKEFVQGLAGKSKTELQSNRWATEIVETIGPTALYLERTLAEATLATQRLEFESEKTISYMCSIPNVKRMSTSYQSASAAGVNYFDMLLVQPMAQEFGVSIDMARNRIAMQEPDYLVAYMLAHLPTLEGLPQELKKQWGEKSLAWNLLALAGNELAYFDSATLIAKYYSLGAHTDVSGRIDKVEHDKAFLNMLASAERAARASARGARIATGAIPVQAKLAYQLAQVLREGDLHDKIDALASYWTASAFSQTAVALARN